MRKKKFFTKKIRKYIEIFPKSNLNKINTQHNTACVTQLKQYIERDFYMRTCIIKRRKIPK